MPRSKRAYVVRLFWASRERAACFLIALIALVYGGCGYRGFRSPAPLPDDRLPIAQPKERKINVAAEAFDKQVTDQLEQLLDISRHARKVFNAPKQALNIDAFGEVPNSTWFTNRNMREKMSIEQIVRGPDTGTGPDTTNGWEIIRAKTEGVTPGFHIEDSRGERYVIKFDPPGYPELATGAEVVSTKLFYAAGYNVPENYIVYFRPEILRLGEKVKFTDEKGRKRLMRKEDLARILNRLERLPSGRIRAVASKYVPGTPIGPFKYTGRRKDDPNDIISHQHRRELRGLRVLSAWLNHFDSKAGNSLDTYVKEGEGGYVEHYLIDFGSTLGSGATGPVPPRTGHENYFDPNEILKKTLTLGMHVRSYEKPDTIYYSSIGRYTSADFHPQKYKFHIPNPAFDNLTGNDGWWGAKIVMSFTDEQLRAVVGAGRYSNPEAAAYLLRVLRERRDIVGRYWSGRMNPIDHFKLEGGSNEECRLCFSDLAVEWGFEPASDVEYRGEILLNGQTIEVRNLRGTDTAVVLPGFSELPDGGRLKSGSAEDGSNLMEIKITTRRKSEGRWSPSVRVFLSIAPVEKTYRLLGLIREE